MNKLAICISATILMLSVTSYQVNAGVQTPPQTTTETSFAPPVSADINPTAPAESPAAINTASKEPVTSSNNQSNRNKRYNKKHNNRDLNVTVRDNGNDGIIYRDHRGYGIYFGGAGLLVLILLLVILL